MPTYEYACTQCGQHVEVFQRLSEAPLERCGVCGGQLRKVFHPAGIVFKGSGFYATDSRSKPTSSGGKDGKDGTDANDAKDAKKGESGASSSASAGSSSGSDASSSGAAGAAASTSGEKAS